MKAIKRRLYLYAGAAAFGGTVSVPFFINITGPGETGWTHLLLILSAAILAAVFAVRESRRLRSAKLIVENQILHIQPAVFQEHRRKKRLKNLSEESVEVFVSGFGILLGSKVIKFNRDGIRLKAVEIGCGHLSLDYGTETASQNVWLLHAGIDSGRLEEMIGRFRYETGIIPIIKDGKTDNSKGGGNMYCNSCGSQISANAKFCDLCGEPAAGTTGGRVGYSVRISDPAFGKYIKNTNRWSAIFSVVLAVGAVVGFFIAGEMGVGDMENPQSLFIGMGLGGMFLLIALFTIIGRKRTKTWDGVVVDKKVKKKQRTQGSEDDYYYVDYLEYVVTVQEDSGKKHRMVAEDDATRYNYFQIGDRVRHHAGLNSYEKYDKSKDSIVLCNACGTLCAISDDICFRCKCPLLK